VRHHHCQGCGIVTQGAAVRPSDIIEHLKNLLQGKEDTDVRSEVEGVAFLAHKTVLAMRSPVFKAKLYGAMSEKDMNRVIISDMQPVVYEALLYFIYTDSLPAMDDLDRNDYIDTTRHLLVAADRYAVERLKILCESILCENNDVNTVVTTLALADQHRCVRLNDACVQFIASLDRMQINEVMASQEYAELKANCPLVLDELWKKTRLGRSKSSLHIGSLVAHK
jgi:speckle-type POZ protein